MQFETHASSAVDSEDGVLPLINIVFLLLVFFMIAGSLSAATPFPMEPVNSQSEPEAESETHKILLGADGQLALDNKPTSLQQMLDTIAAAAKTGGEFRLQVSAHADAEARALVALFEQLRELDVEKVQLLTTHSGPAEASDK